MRALRCLLPSLLAVAGCAKTPTEAPAAPDGAALYRRESCTVCHGPNGEGSALAPGLQGLAPHWSEETLVRYLADPAAYAAGDERLREQAQRYPQMMPPYGALSAAERQAMARFVLALPP